MADSSDGPPVPGGTVTPRQVAPSRRVPSLAEDASAGLLARPRALPPKYFYDARGSDLFDAICTTPEYYPTRLEEQLLAASSQDIMHCARPATLLELGAGASRKTGHLLRASTPPPLYAPYDICPEIMIAAAHRLQSVMPELQVIPLEGDYHAGLAHVPALPEPVLWAFLGGTIGNFEPAEAAAFLAELHRAMSPGDWLLLGADRLKTRDVLEAAYNDGAGWTAAFNRNVLNVLNRELDADFDLDAFRHHAYFNENAGHIEMHLVSDVPQVITLRGLKASMRLAAGESIRTEISRKFSREGLETLVAAAGFDPARHYEAEDGWFSLVLARR